MVRVYVPAGVAVLVVIVSVELPDPVTEGRLNVEPAPAGEPLTLKATALLKPFTAVIDTA
jgi:hypothetical protein